MIEIRRIKIPVEKADRRELERRIMKKLRMRHVPRYRILKRSIDARKKPDIYYIYQVGVTVQRESEVVKKINDSSIALMEEQSYDLPKSGIHEMQHHPLIIGAGPAGLFCGLILAKMGYVPVIVEQGLPVVERVKEVENFWQTGRLNVNCNVQFGEGGAGTFSDGKLNTQVKDTYGRIRYVLETFVKHGAPEEILYDSKPHVGTDRLIRVVKGIREEIEAYGGVFLFQTKATDFRIENGQVTAAKLLHDGFETWVESTNIVLAIGHSARDTFAMLHDKGIAMQPKDFSMGVRIEHKASMIQEAMYGSGEAAKILPAAPYKLSYQTENGRGVYSFCMCPGGYVVNASSEEGGTAVNGMSYSGRNGENSNSAIVVTVKTSDYMQAEWRPKEMDDAVNGSDTENKNIVENPLCGIQFQRKLEQAAYKMGGGKVPVQRFADFCENRTAEEPEADGMSTTPTGGIVPQIKGGYTYGNVRACLPEFIADAIEEGIFAFDRTIKGFADGEAVLSGVESRTSSPVRVTRNEQFLANVRGIYPCGEGAGYAGGIVSAAVDGMKVAEAVISRYMPKKTPEGRKMQVHGSKA